MYYLQEDVEALYLVRTQEKGDALTMEEENDAYLEVNPPTQKQTVYGLGNLGRALAAAAHRGTSTSTSSSGSHISDELAALRAQNEKIMAENEAMKQTQNVLVSQVETQNLVLKKILERVPIGMDPFAEGGFDASRSPGMAGSAGMMGSSHVPEASGSGGPRP